MIQIKRIYEQAEQSDGLRVLVDRLWPRGISKAKAKLDHWLKEIAPSDELRHWFTHDPARWDEFKSRYQQELESEQQQLITLVAMAKKETVTLLYAAKNTEQNNAVVLKEVIEQMMEKKI